jgi:phosphatidylinositol alpha-1,6-mannosyltransferase
MIVVLTQCFPPSIGGIEVLMKGLADSLTTAGRDVMVLADGHRDPQEAVHDQRFAFPVQRFAGVKPWRWRRKARALEALTRDARLEAVFTDSWKSAEHVIELLKICGVPVVCLAHGNDVLAKGRARRRRRIRNVLGKAKRVAANSADTARRVRDLGVAPEQVVVVNPGVAPPAPPSEDARTRMTDRIGRGRPLLLTLARIEPRKGQDQVITVLPDLLADFPELTYVIAGDGPYRSRLNTLARDLGVAPRVRFLGRVSEDEKAALFEMADLFVMPVREDASTQSVEGFGIAYVEAAFRALPCVGGRGGGAGDAVIDGETGALCDGDDPGDVEKAIRNCLADPEGLQRLGAAARRRAEREFTWPIACERYLACLN